MSAAEWEAAFARLLLDDGFRARLWSGDDAALASHDLDASERAVLIGLDRAEVERFAAGLIRKRLLRLRGALPVTFRAIEPTALDSLVTRYRAAHPSVPAACAREVRTFAEVTGSWASSRGEEWLAELVDWEATGHLAWCHDAIDAEGAVAGHLRTSPAPESVNGPTTAGAGRPADRHRRAPGAWAEVRRRDLPRLATWYESTLGRPGAPPDDLLREQDVTLLRTARPGPSNRGVVASPAMRMLWERLDGSKPTAELAASIDPQLRGDALAAMLDHLVRLGLIEPVMSPPSGRSWLARVSSRIAEAGPTPAGEEPRADAAPSWDQASVPAFGIGLRRPHAALLQSTRASELDVLEVYAEDYVAGDAASSSELARLRELYLVIPHGLELSLGSLARPERTALASLRHVLDALGAPFYTEHLAWTRAPEWRPGHLCPIWPTREAIDRIADRITLIQDALGRPLAIENISYDVRLPGTGLAEADVFGELVERTGCRMLLDLTNVAVNAHNHGFDAAEFLQRLPLEAVVQFHLVGYTAVADGTWVDAHGEATSADLLELGRLAMQLGAQPRAVVIERDRDLPTLEELCREVDAVRRALS